jgi:hypothetical protein
MLHALPILCILYLLVAVEATKSSLFANIAALTFKPNQPAKRIRAPRAEQVVCIGVCPPGLPPVRCERNGNSWECTAKGFVISEAHITCEGLSKPDDKSIVVGSCSVSCDANPEPPMEVPWTQVILGLLALLAFWTQL